MFRPGAMEPPYAAIPHGGPCAQLWRIHVKFFYRLRLRVDRCTDRSYRSGWLSRKYQRISWLSEADDWTFSCGKIIVKFCKILAPHMNKPKLRFWSIWNLSFGFFGIQIGFALQNANVSRIFQTLGASIDSLAILWLAAPVTGFLVQPIVGHFSDRTWIWLGRRRPYFLAGASFATLALFIMPNAPALWAAAAALWMLDLSINVAMEPFRAFVGDLLPNSQRTQGFSMQSVFIGSGALLASMAPYALTNFFHVSNAAAPGEISDAVRYAFYIGGTALLLSVLWTIVTTREYSPEEIASFEEATLVLRSEEAQRESQNVSREFFVRYGCIFLIVGLAIAAIVAYYSADKQLYVLGGGLSAFGLAFLLNARLRQVGRDRNFFSQVLADLVTMPPIMRRLAVVQFFSWCGLFLLWIFTTPTVALRQFGAIDATSAAYNNGADWVGVLFAAYNGVAALYAFMLPFLAKRFGERSLHSINLCAGALGLVSFLVVRDPQLLLVSMVGVGMAWASILTVPYAILSEALPSAKMGVYMGIFNFFIVLPQITVAGIMGPIVRAFFDDDPAWALAAGAAALVCAAIAMAFVRLGGVRVLQRYQSASDDDKTALYP